MQRRLFVFLAVAAAELALAAVLIVAAPAVARARDERFPDSTTRAAVIGCWDVGQGATLTLTEYGKHSVWAEARFSERPKGGPKKISALAAWIEGDGELEVACRPRSQHGSFCRVRPAADGKLQVRVYGKGYKSGVAGKLSEDFTASSCP
jgi:hypothetical protein